MCRGDNAGIGGRSRRWGSLPSLTCDWTSEPGADIDAEAAAAKAAGINFVHLPLNSSAADPAVADRFIKTITEPGTQPAFIQCASGNRAAAMWLIKRVLIDKWDNDRALEEAAQLGLTSQVLKTFALDYIQAHKK
jgi:protein tyrosine phosphatase (PTP) superfamily phosphohydrolase (DUF442 family)